MADRHQAWKRQGEAFWRAHHEAWKRSDLNQRQYCEAEDIPLKAFGNWRAVFKAEPQPPERKLLYRRRGLSPPFSPQLSPPFSPPLNPRAYPSSRSASPIVARPREGHRRRFSEADKRQILDQAAQDVIRPFNCGLMSSGLSFSLEGGSARPVGAGHVAQTGRARVVT